MKSNAGLQTMLVELKQWWDALNSLGPHFGYFPNAKKCCIIAKPDKQAGVREAFKDTVINVTVEGQKHLGAVIGSRDYLENYVSEKVDNWVSEVAQLAGFAQAQPQASYAAYWRIFVYIFCVISICSLVSTRATKSLVLNIERTSQN